MEADVTEQKLQRMEEELVAAKKVLAAEKSRLQKLQRRKRSYRPKD